MMKTSELEFKKPYVNNPRRWVLDRLSEDVKCPSCECRVPVNNVKWMNRNEDIFRCPFCAEIIYIF